MLCVLDGSDYMLPHKAKIIQVIVHKAIPDNNYYNGNIRGLSGRAVFQFFFFYGQPFNKTILYNSMTQNLKTYYASAHSIIGFGSQKIVSLIICDPQVLHRVDLLLDDQETPAALHTQPAVCCTPHLMRLKGAKTSYCSDDNLWKV
jgi:hypothetical protein